MQGRIRKILLIILLAQFLYSCSAKKQQTLTERLDQFFQKSEVTIAVTDSGLGGLSVMADAAERMREAKIFQEVNLVFFQEFPQKLWIEEMQLIILFNPVVKKAL